MPITYAKPEFELLVVRGEGSIYAKVVSEASCQAINLNGSRRYGKAILTQGGLADSPQHALENLLDVTIIALEKLGSGDLVVEEGKVWVGAGSGGYYKTEA